jgi:hypothetical protein
MTKWIDDGAVPSQTVATLLTQIGYTEKYQKAKKGEDVTEIKLKNTITERKKKTRKMKKAAVVVAEQAAAAAAAEAAPAEEKKEESPSE